MEMKKNVLTIVLVLICGICIVYAYQQKSAVSQLNEEIVTCQEAAEASSAEAFILQQLAEKHKAEAEEHRQAAEEHKKIAEEAMEQVQKLKN